MARVEDSPWAIPVAQIASRAGQSKPIDADFPAPSGIGDSIVGIKEGEYSITSSGEIMAFGVDVPELSCKMTGNGTMEVHPTNNLKANVVGKGKIRYKGPTAVQQKIIGKGSVEEVK